VGVALLVFGIFWDLPIPPGLEYLERAPSLARATAIRASGGLCKKPACHSVFARSCRSRAADRFYIELRRSYEETISGVAIPCAQGDEPRLGQTG